MGWTVQVPMRRAAERDEDAVATPQGSVYQLQLNSTWLRRGNAAAGGHGPAGARRFDMPLLAVPTVASGSMRRARMGPPP
ncbi:hypothetical protein ABZ455_39770 [Streptomyces avermitilis]